MTDKTMDLIERYVHEVGRHLPRKNRADIQVELQSALIDALEDRLDGEPAETDVVALLQDYGSPKKVAASYFPEGQYLIGPALFPLFRMVTGIVLAAVLGAQLLAWAVAAFIAQQPFEPLEAVAGMLNSLPAAIGMVVIVFAILQWFDVRPDATEELWDPQKLPQLGESEDVKRGERILGIVGGVVILAVLAYFRGEVGFVTSPGGTFFANPVIARYFGWISLSLLAGIGLDIYLLWQGRWQTATRLAKLAANLFSIVILVLLVQGHTAWLAERGVGGFLSALERLPQDISGGTQIIAMQGFRMAFGVALVVTVVETAVQVFRLLRATLDRSSAATAPAPWKA